MPPKPAPPSVDRYGLIVDPESGLSVPRAYRSIALTDVLSRVSGGVDGRGFSEGNALTRDPDTLAVKWPMKGSGLDEFVSQSIVDGTVANVGVSPVVAPQISAMVARQQKQAVTATIDLTGRAYPVRLARDAIARFNDSPMGVTDALQQIVYSLCTYNRGAPIATVPIVYALDRWEEYGLNIRPLVAENEKEESASRFYLEVDWVKHGTPIPYLPSIYDLEPSGIQEWPYWYRVLKDNRPVWVLLHQTHILPFTPGKSSKFGIGTSPVWMCLGVLAEQILVIEERSEKLLYTMTDGITLLGGVESASGETILDAVAASRADAVSRGFVAAKGNTILTSPSADKVSIATVSFRQNPNVPFEGWRQYTEDVITFCFSETLSAMVIRGGVGFGVQSETASENAAETGVGAILYMTGATLGTIYPRVQVSVSRPNDRAQRLNIATLKTFSEASAPLIDRQVITPQEARAMIDRDIISIPEVGIDTVSTTANADDTTDDTNSSGTADENDQPADEDQTTDETT